MINRNIRILLIGSNIWYFGEGMFGPLLAVFAEKIGGNILDISWAWATYLIASGLFVMIVGRIADRIGKKKVMIAGYVLNSVFTFSYILVQNTSHLFLVQAGLGLATALATPTWEALYGKSYESSGNETYIWGLATGQSQIATGIAIIIGGLIVSRFSFTFLFAVMGTIQVIATLYQSKILKSNVSKIT